jgi:hypothetical protein
MIPQFRVIMKPQFRFITIPRSVLSWYLSSVLLWYPSSVLSWNFSSVLSQYPVPCYHDTLVPCYYDTPVPCYHETSVPFHHDTPVPCYHDTPVLSHHDITVTILFTFITCHSVPLYYLICLDCPCNALFSTFCKFTFNNSKKKKKNLLKQPHVHPVKTIPTERYLAPKNCDLKCTTRRSNINVTFTSDNPGEVHSQKKRIWSNWFPATWNYLHGTSALIPDMKQTERLRSFKQ